MKDKELTKLQEYMFLIMGSNDNEPMTKDHLKAVLLMCSKNIPELAEVMPDTIEIFGETFNVRDEEYHCEKCSYTTTTPALLGDGTKVCPRCIIATTFPKSI